MRFPQVLERRALEIMCNPPRLPYECLPATEQVEHVSYVALRAHTRPTFDRVLSVWTSALPRDIWDQIDSGLPSDWKDETSDFTSALAHPI